MKIIFFGTPHFAAVHLQALVDAGIEIVAIVTKPDKPQGRSLQLHSPAIKELAAKILPNVPFFQPEKCSTAEFVEVLRGIQADLYVVVAYGEIMKQDVLDIPRFGCINVHASILPQYRGAAPIQRSLMHGDEMSGVTIIQLILKMDAGDMLAQTKVAVPESMTCPELEKKLCEVGPPTLLKVIQDFENGTVSRIPQDESLVTYAHKITVEECKIDWSKPGKVIHNLVRAVTPHPGAWCMVTVRNETKRLKVLRSEYTLSAAESKQDLVVPCGEGFLRILELQLEGKRAMPSQEFLKGVSAAELLVGGRYNS